MKPMIIPDRRGKNNGITAEMVKTIIDVAKEWKTQGRRLRERSFTDHIRKEHNIDLSRKTVSDILIANDRHRISTKRRRPRFYQSIRQTVPNGLISIDGSEMTIVIDHVPYTFNLEMAVDVRSYCHSAFHIGDTETSEEVIRVIEEHIVNHGPPLGMLADHRSGNLSSETLSYLNRKEIDLVPAGPGNPKGNGTIEGAFSELKEAIGNIRLDTSSPRALAKSILKIIVSLYIRMRNRIPRTGEKATPIETIKLAVSEQERKKLREHYQRRIKKTDAPDMNSKLDRLDWIIRNHNLEIDEPSYKRAQKCITAYELAAIAGSEAAFLVAIRRDNGRCTLPYFFGILRNKQQEMDDDAYREYCIKRYDYSSILERDRKRKETEAQSTTTVGDLVSMLQSALSAQYEYIREICIRQVERMVKTLKNNYRYTGILKKKIADAIGKINELSLSQKKEAMKLVEQFLT